MAIRPEIIFAASLTVSAFAIPVGLLVLDGGVLPGGGSGGGAAEKAESSSEPLTLITEPMMVPDRAVGDYRVVVVEVDLPDRTAANAMCRNHPLISDRVHLYLEDGDRAPATAKSGHDATLAYLLEKIADGPEIPAAALVTPRDVRERYHDRPLFECRGDVAWEMPKRP